MPKLNPNRTIKDVREKHKTHALSSYHNNADEINEKRRIEYALKHPKKPKKTATKPAKTKKVRHTASPVDTADPDIVVATQAPTIEPEGRQRVIAGRTPKYTAEELMQLIPTFNLTKGTETIYLGQVRVVQENIGLNDGLLSIIKVGIRDKIEAFHYKNKPNKPLGDNSKKAAAQLLVWLLTKLDLDDKADVDGRNELHEYFNEMKIRSSDITEHKRNTQLVPVWSDYLEHVESKFGKESKEYLIASIYYEVPARDDFGNIKFQLSKNDDSNQVIIPGSGRGRVYVSEFKTSGKYDPIDMPLSVALTGMIRKYITANKIAVGKKLFPHQLSKTVGDMNKTMGYTGSTGVTMFRQMHAPVKGEKVDARTRMSTARDMKHSIEAQQKYIRGRLPIGHWRPAPEPEAAPAPARKPRAKKTK